MMEFRIQNFLFITDSSHLICKNNFSLRCSFNRMNLVRTMMLFCKRRDIFLNLTHLVVYKSGKKETSKLSSKDGETFKYVALCSSIIKLDTLSKHPIKHLSTETQLTLPVITHLSNPKENTASTHGDSKLRYYAPGDHLTTLESLTVIS